MGQARKQTLPKQVTVTIIIIIIIYSKQGEARKSKWRRILISTQGEEVLFCMTVDTHILALADIFFPVR